MSAEGLAAFGNFDLCWYMGGVLPIRGVENKQQGLVSVYLATAWYNSRRRWSPEIYLRMNGVYDRLGRL